MAHHSIRKIKSLIQANEGVDSDRFTLIYDGNILEEDSTLSSLNITSESKLQLVFCPSEVLSISVKFPTGDIVKLKVKVLFTVNDLKAIVANMTNGSVVGHDLYYGGMKLEDFKTLSCYDIKNDFLLELLTPQFQIFVTTWSGKTVTLDVRQCNTIRDVRDKLCHKLQIPPGIHCIIVLKYFKLDKDLASYNIKEHSTLRVIWLGSTKVPLNSIDPSISLTTSISDVKKMARVKFEADVKKLLIKEVALRDDRTLASYVEDLSEKVDVSYFGESSRFVGNMWKNAITIN